MDTKNPPRLEAVGFVETTVEELFGLTPEEAKHIQDKLIKVSEQKVPIIEKRRKSPLAK